MMVAPDALAAKIAQSCGAKAVFSAGYAHQRISLNHARSWHQRLWLRPWAFAGKLSTPSTFRFADADTGYGDLDNVKRTVECYEAIGTAGIFIEDQVWPKRCGHMDGKKVEPTEVLEAKIKAAKAARKHDDFLIMSRTDARAVYGLDDAIERSRHYKATGADPDNIEAPQSSEELEKIHEAFPDTPMMANMIEDGGARWQKRKIWNDSVSTSWFTPTPWLTQTYAEEQLVKTLQRDGTTKAYKRSLSSLSPNSTSLLA